MAYIEGVDYWVRLVEFPNMASPSVAVSNGDGTFTIYVNSRFSPEKRAAGLRHELEHLEGQHFYRDDVELGELEAAADGRLPSAPPRRAAGGGTGSRSTGTATPSSRISSARPRPEPGAAAPGAG